MISYELSKQPEPVELNVNDLPYLYQNEYVMNARSHIHRGFFVYPNGKKFKYHNPSGWNYDIYVGGNTTPPIPLTPRDDFATAYISVDHLFSNVKSCEPAFALSSLLGVPKLDANLLSELLRSTVRGHESGLTDTGRWTNSLYIYCPKDGVYIKVLLSETGLRELTNTSPNAAGIISIFGKVGGKAY